MTTLVPAFRRVLRMERDAVGPGILSSRNSCARLSTTPREHLRRMVTEKTILLFGPYKAPALNVGDLSWCLFRNVEVVIYDWTIGPISWPLCHHAEIRAFGKGILAEARHSPKNCNASRTGAVAAHNRCTTFCRSCWHAWQSVSWNRQGQGSRPPPRRQREPRTPIDPKGRTFKKAWRSLGSPTPDTAPWGRYPNMPV
jgi:hypothetical protein